MKSNIFHIQKDAGQSEDRNLVIHCSTQIETDISDLLNLAIGDHERKSKSFGFTSQSLSFNAKVNLLIDFNIFSKEQKKIFQVFMEIRNKFAHNHRVNSFGWFINNPDGKDCYNYLKKEFSNKIDDFKSDSKSLKAAFLLMIEKIEEALNYFQTHLINRSGDIAVNEYKLRIYDTLIELLDDNGYINSLIGSPNEILSQIFSEIQKRLELKNKSLTNDDHPLKNKIIF